MDKMTGARLDILEITLKAVLKRQGIIAALVAVPNCKPSDKIKRFEEMSKVLDEWTLEIKDIEENFKHGK